MATYDVVQAVRKKQYTGNGTAGPFAFPFQINASSQIKVYVDSVEKDESTHYTVSIST